MTQLQPGARPATQGPLSEEQVAFFHREGYLMVPDVFTDADLQPVIDELTAELDTRARKLVAEGKLSRTYEEEDFAHRLAKISRETDAVAMGMWSGVLSNPAFFNLIRHPRLLDLAQQFCGEELIASSVYRLRPKLPSFRFGEVPWHQDAGYLETYCERYLVLTVWLPLVDATEENGCMWVLPRVHRKGILEHARREIREYLIIPKDALPPVEPVCCPVPKGGVLLLTNLTPHASFRNQTDAVRWSMDLRYQNAALPTNAPITKLPDEVLPDSDEAPPACYAPEADFLVRSRRRPEQVLTDPAEFNRIRKQHLSQPVKPRWQRVVAE